MKALAMTTPCAYGNVLIHPASRRTAVGLLWLSIIASLLLGGRVQAQRPRLSNDAQLMVNRSIEYGRKYLLSRQTPQGNFPGPGHPVGVTALAGLALMECGMDASDLALRAAASFIIAQTKSLEDTYDLSLAILFLDRLGGAKYKGRIQTLALRLIAGQTLTGGWSYECPTLSVSQQSELLKILRQLEQIEKAGAVPAAAGGKEGNVPAPAAADAGKGAKPTGVASDA